MSALQRSVLLQSVKKPTDVPVGTGVIYSAPGKGKTHLLCTACELFEKALIITLDRSDETIAKFPKVDVLDLVSVAQGSLHEAMQNLIKELRVGLRKWDFVGFDSLSKLMHLERMEIIREAHRKDDRHDPDVAEQRDYLKLTNRLCDYFWELRSIAIKKNFHLFVTAWERDEYIESGVYTGDFYYPDMSPELGRLIIHEYSFCCRLTARKEVIRVRRNGKMVAVKTTVRTLHGDGTARDSIVKNRLGLPDRMVGPSVPKMLGAHSQPTSIEEVEEENGHTNQSEEG